MDIIDKYISIYNNTTSYKIKENICKKISQEFANNNNIPKAIEWFNKKTTENTNEEHKYLVNLYLQTNQIQKAIHHLTEISKKSFNSNEMIVLAGLYNKIGNINKSYNIYQSLLLIKPNNMKMLNNIAEIEMMFDKTTAMSRYKKALSIEKHYAIMSNLIINSLYSSDINNHYAYVKQFAFNLTIQQDYIKPSNNKIHIGYISNEFLPSDSGKPVHCFIQHIIKNHSDKFKVFCYYVHRNHINHPAPPMIQFDNMVCRNLTNMNIPEIQQTILDDSLNILVELMNHTSGNVLEIFQKRMANIQISYCAFPGTTGIKTIDYKLVDKICAPFDSSQYSEKFLYINGPSHCYVPTYQHPPKISIEKYEESLKHKKHIVLCSFANPKKLNKKILSLWSQILFRNDNFKLYLRHPTYSSSIVVKHIKQQLHEINDSLADKFIFIQGHPDYAKILHLYNEIDVFLDTFPYNGTTTICEALSMGVPVITLSGEHIHERMGHSILHYAELDDLVCRNDKEYVNTVIKMADKTHLLDVRKRVDKVVFNSGDFMKQYESLLTGLCIS